MEVIVFPRPGHHLGTGDVVVVVRNKRSTAPPHIEAIGMINFIFFYQSLAPLCEFMGYLHALLFRHFRWIVTLEEFALHHTGEIINFVKKNVNSNQSELLL